ncbi:Beta-1,4-mannooligosaccharide phosphorylase [Posidoniimonas corsicana]|uniref:Beta-1,4-mannooligosaccharide phosphorylase n=1 Tax=Posidoniimonas corsicana TaxID=1938618 RepID=A0A5C5VCE2_9BACT|nr:glycoside hydrolase family 130 protein [Posidoniimonas corsicana]TWT35941.1 Beta-1,4-mannooligosaccharide phosphorylase [Posidoniimonas corsicana]
MNPVDANSSDSQIARGATADRGGVVPDAFPWQERPAGDKAVVWRHSGNPIIPRNPLPDVHGIYNSAVVRFGDGYAGVFRTEGPSRFPLLHAGWSEDGLEWQIEARPIEFSNYRPDPSHYAYDPRVVRIEDWFYVSWCGGDNGPTISLARTKDFRAFERLPNAFLPFNRNGVLFPRRINDKFVMLSRPSDDGHTPFGDIYVSESPDMVHWGMHRLVMRRGGDQVGQWWQRTKIGAGPIPIETPDGWLMIYHGVIDTCNGFVYSMGAAILAIDDPSKVLYRTNRHLLTPEAPYETTGHVPNVVFPCAALHEPTSGKLAVYYGAADTCTCVAYCNVSELVEFTKANSTVF